MHSAADMDGRKGVAELAEDSASFGPSETGAPDAVVQAFALQELQDQVSPPFHLAAAEKRHDVRMLYPAERDLLPPYEPVRIVERYAVGRGDLQRDAPSALHIEAGIDIAHPAAGDLPGHPEPPLELSAAGKDEALQLLALACRGRWITLGNNGPLGGGHVRIDAGKSI